MTSQSPTPPEVELDLERYELRRRGRIKKLEKLPMELLILLAQRPGQLVTRAQIAEHLWRQDAYVDADGAIRLFAIDFWGKDTTVDGDAAIDTVVRKIRRVLGDDAEKPRYVETVGGEGYRFVGPSIVSCEAP